MGRFRAITSMGLRDLKVVQLLVNAPCIFAAGIERLGIDDHHVDPSIGAEALQLCSSLEL